MGDNFLKHPTISRDQTSSGGKTDDFSILLVKGPEIASLRSRVSKVEEPDSTQLPIARPKREVSHQRYPTPPDGIVAKPTTRGRPRSNAFSGGQPPILQPEVFSEPQDVAMSESRDETPLFDEPEGVWNPSAIESGYRYTPRVRFGAAEIESFQPNELNFDSEPSPGIAEEEQEESYSSTTLPSSHTYTNTRKRRADTKLKRSEPLPKRRNVGLHLPESVLGGEIGEEDDNSTEDASRLDQRIADLHSQIKALQAKKRRHIPQEWRFIHRVHHFIDNKRIMQYYLDQPRWYGGIEGHEPLAGTEPILDLKSYLERHIELAFVVFQDYGPGWPGGRHFSESIGEAPRKSVEDGYPLPNAESTKFVYPGMQQTMQDFLQSLPYNHGIMFPHDKSWPQEIQAPYLSVYHHREAFYSVTDSIKESIRKPWSLFVEYLNQSFQAEYSDVDLQFQQGLVSPRFLKYLIKPGDILHYPSHRTVEAVQVVSALSKAKNSHNTFSSLPLRNGLGGENEGDLIISHADAQEKPRRLMSWSIEFTFWSFNTTFKRERGQVQLEMSVGVDVAVPIRSLIVYPLHLADAATREKIEARGTKLWKFRSRGYVEYSKDEDVHAWSSIRSRYMIDPLTYRLMHQTAQTESTGPSPDDLPEKQFQNDDCPAYPFPVLLPRIVRGYNFTEKKWVDLELDYLKDVEWNTKAFENLVTGTETKELLEALVKNQLKLETSTDLIAGKGNGLIILLHGGPGTGKTYTAESVADYARKPLYRVTCGDIGTKPVEVERYLETVLRLGRIWGCVVLLDEADIFLEERTLSDLDRNALVSVFLRVLEYYTGILILTSNRVGHFDEAFRSRIQLALHYESLDQEQRHSIWANFIKHLYNSDSCRMDFADLQLNINKLSKEEMNGRQIRNAITTARQYADFKDKPLNYEVIKKVITIAGRFDRYLHDVKKARRVKNGNDDDEIARDAGAR
jgi:hypothetical protein